MTKDIEILKGILVTELKLPIVVLCHNSCPYIAPHDLDITGNDYYCGSKSILLALIVY
jgi:hypothetical protein